MTDTAARFPESQIAAFSQEIGEFIYKIQTARRLDATQFGRAEIALTSIAEALRHDALLPKDFLNELRTTIRILRAENDHFEDRQKLNQLADKLEHIFDLILMGEAPADRVPGQPRIV